MKNDGGPAFPDYDAANGISDSGMTLRDYFAGQAVVGLLAASATHFGKADPIFAASEAAYIVADAMLAAREQS